VHHPAYQHTAGMAGQRSAALRRALCWANTVQGAWRTTTTHKRGGCQCRNMWLPCFLGAHCHQHGPIIMAASLQQ